MPAPRTGIQLEILERKHAEECNDFFNQSFQQSRSLDHYLWKFWQNPAGEPIGMVARDVASGKIVAANTGIVRRFQVGGAEARALYAVENAVAPAARGGGFLFRAVTAGMVCRAHKHKVLFAYGGQSTEDAIRIGKRLFNYQDLVCLKPWRQRLSIAPALKPLLGEPVAKVVAGILDPVVVATTTARAEFKVEKLAQVDERINVLWNRLKNQHPVCTVRDQSTMKWRWQDCPIGPNQILLATSRGKPAGLLVWRKCKEGSEWVARVLDYFVDESVDGVGDALLAAAATSAQKSSCSFLTLACSADSNLAKCCKGHPGFVSDKNDVDDQIIGTVMDYPDGTEQEYYQQRMMLNGKQWHYMQGDIDYRD